MKFTPRISCILIVTLSCFLLFSCNKDKDKPKKPAAPQATPVAVIKASIRSLPVKYQSSGSLTPITHPTLKAEINGRVTQVRTYDGAEVKTNQVLATLGHEKQQIAYLQAKAHLVAAKATVHEKDLEQQSKYILMKKGITSKLSYAQAVAAVKVTKARVNVAEQNLLHAENELSNTIIRSPITGNVEKVLASQGETVTIGTPLFKLINHSLLQARLPFSEKRASDFKIGQRVHLLSPATPGKEYVGQVTAITPSINPLNRSLDVIVTFNSDNLWHSGASIQGKVYLEEKINAIVVPTESIVLRGNRSLVFTVVNGKAMPHVIKVIEETNGAAAISSNIKSGAMIVTHGAQYLAQGSPVSVPKPKSAPTKVLQKHIEPVTKANAK